jgi:ParB-like chromosome segregation protein Spo0J
MISESIKTFGFTNPILTDQNNTIIAGHGRLEAAKLLGITKVPTVCLENLNQDQIRAYVIADNRLAEKAGWDESILAIELQHLATVDLGFDVTITGFETGLRLESSREEKRKQLRRAIFSNERMSWCHSWCCVRHSFVSEPASLTSE